jgi:hypothetical protein
VSEPPFPRRRRRGLGCLPSLILLLAFGLAVAVIVDTIIGPWIYTVGGRQRFLPMWEGVGDAQGPGGTYRLYVWFAPASRGSRILPNTSVAGYSTLCTPKGERLNLKLYGGAPGRAWLRMEEGHPFGLQVFRRTVFSLSGPIGPPRLEFEGHWQGDALVMSDRGDFAHAFRPDGSVVEDGVKWHSNVDAVPITLTEQTWGLFPPACPQR